MNKFETKTSINRKPLCCAAFQRKVPMCTCFRNEMHSLLADSHRFLHDRPPSANPRVFQFEWFPPFISHVLEIACVDIIIQKVLLSLLFKMFPFWQQIMHTIEVEEKTES